MFQWIREITTFFQNTKFTLLNFELILLLLYFKININILMLFFNNQFINQ